MTLQRTSCILDCPDTCGLEVAVRDGKIARISGRTDHPDTQGFICGKVAHFDRRVYHSSRLLYPMKRVGPKGSGSFQRIDWREAVETIADRLQHTRDLFGGEAILPYHYGGSNGLLGDGGMDRLFFSRLQASRLAKTICAAPTTTARKALYGDMPGTAFGDFAQARFILIWGANPKGSNIHLIPYLKEAKRRGAYIAVVDPINRFSAQEIDLHLGVRPGCDLPLALSLIHYWREHQLLDRDFMDRWSTGADRLLEAASRWPLPRAAEVCGLEPDRIEELALTYARSEPALLRSGWGMERNRNGCRAAAAILALPTLLGKFGTRGSGFTASNSSATQWDAEAVFGPMPWTTRELNMTQLGDILLDLKEPPIKSLFIYNSNPVATSPHQHKIEKGLSREDLFTVVFEQNTTDTALYGDILLPATTFMETREIRKSYGSYVLGGIKPVIAPVCEAKSNPEVFALLGRALGFEDEPFRWELDEVFRRTAREIRLQGKPADVERLAKGNLDLHRFEGKGPIGFVHVFPQNRRVNLAPDHFGADPYGFQPRESGGYPLALITPASHKLITSSLGEYNLNELRVTLHPRDASERGLVDGDTVRVFNELGEVVCKLQVSDRIAAGVAMMPKGAWRKASVNGTNPTALCPDHVEPLSGGACFNDARVEIRGANP